MTPPDIEPDSEGLIRLAGRGVDAARQRLLSAYRVRLRRMVAVRMDPRLASRVDASDVVQEALALADRRLDDFLRDRPIAFYPWLRQIAWERLVELHRRHVGAGRRSVTREEVPREGPGGASALALADRLIDDGTSPSRRLVRAELRERVREALARLRPRDREILVLR